MTCTSTYNFIRNLVLGGFLNLFESQLFGTTDWSFACSRNTKRVHSVKSLCESYTPVRHQCQQWMIQYIVVSIPYASNSIFGLSNVDIILPREQTRLTSQSEFYFRMFLKDQSSGLIPMTSFRNPPRVRFFEQQILFDLKSTLIRQ